MTTTSYNVQNEGASNSRPPFFYENEYVYWKDKMIIYLQSIDYDLWLSIENRPYKPTKIENDIIIPKPRSEFNIISSCKSTRDIWHVLEVTHEDTNQVKEFKIDMLVHQYELFKILQMNP